jgi:tyrosine-protein phosphatase SIW14
MTVSFRQITILLAFALIPVGYVSAQTSKDLPNFYRVNAQLFRGGQPTEAGIKQLAAMGIRTVIDLRDDDGRARKEQKRVEGAGLRFVNVPLGNWFGPKDADVARVIAAIVDKAAQPVFVHCKRGSDRTGTMIAVYRISHENWTSDQATEEATKFGLGWWQVWMKGFIKDYYRDFKAGSVVKRPPTVK